MRGGNTVLVDTPSALAFSDGPGAFVETLRKCDGGLIQINDTGPTIRSLL
jgi:hypothetical protein